MQYPLRQPLSARFTPPPSYTSSSLLPHLDAGEDNLIIVFCVYARLAPCAAKECSDLWTLLPALVGVAEQAGTGLRWAVGGECNLCAAHMELALLCPCRAAATRAVPVADDVAFCFVFLFMDFHWLAATSTALSTGTTSTSCQNANDLLN